jgi:hypothetical protein
VKTLIHEKIHVYQRAYRPSILQTLYQNGYIPKMSRQQLAKNVKLIRANPDLDHLIYYHSKYGNMYSYYNSELPRDVGDVSTSGGEDTRYEHPFELMAYEVSSAIASKIAI